VQRGISSWPPTGTIDVRKLGLSLRLHSDPTNNLAARLFWNPDEWERKEFGLFLSLAREAEVILDIGANIGVYSLAARLANPRARVVAFEPNPVNVRELSRNLALNGINDVEVRPVALGAARAELPFFVPVDNRTSDVSNVGNPEFIRLVYPDLALKDIKVPVETLDDVVRDMAIAQVQLIKMDVEMYEYQVVQGAQQLLASQRPLVMCELHHPDELSHRLGGKLTEDSLQCGRRVYQFFSELGYTCYLLSEDGLFRTPVAPVPGHANVLFSPHTGDKDFIPYAQVVAALSSAGEGGGRRATA
jgi:FkbM family methyltransferase